MGLPRPTYTTGDSEVERKEMEIEREKTGVRVHVCTCVCVFARLRGSVRGVKGVTVVGDGRER